MANQDEDLEELQRQFFESNREPSVSVLRAAPPQLNAPKKQSLFAQRRAEKKQHSDSEIPPLEPQGDEPPPLESQGTASLEPVVDPFEEPYKPAVKKMLDLTSMLGNVLGQVKERKVDKVEPPMIHSSENISGLSSQRHVDGFPEPIHRREYRKTAHRPASAKDQGEQLSDVHVENMSRIQSMSEQEIIDAQDEILSTLSKQSVAILRNRNRNKAETKTLVDMKAAPVQGATRDQPFDEDLLAMKNKYFADVPLEREKLAWIDDCFATPEEGDQVTQGLLKPHEHVYRKVRFDLRGCPINSDTDIPRHQGLHHHGDDPEKAGYTLAELFHLVRSQVPSQRAMVLNTLARILWQTKAHIRRNDDNTQWWQGVLDTFLQHEVAAPVYLRSAMDDRSLVVLTSAIEAMAALVLDHTSLEDTMLDSSAFNQHLGHVAFYENKRPMRKKGLVEKFSAMVDQVQPLSDQEESDAMLAERNLTEGLLRMGILARIRYLMDPDGNLRRLDRTSVEWLVLILVQLAESGPGVCVAIEQEGLLPVVLDWGVNKTCWPMTEENEDARGYPSLSAVRLLTLLAQGKKTIAKDIVQTAGVTLQFLVVSPDIACIKHRRRASALQLETLKLMRVLLCYGLVMPTLEDLQGPITDWLRAAFQSQDADVSARAAAALCLLEVLLQAAADPHRTMPAHAVDWPQATAALPLVTAVLRTRRNPTVYNCALGYLATWVSHIDKFRPPGDDLREIWKAVTANTTMDETADGVLRYVQFLAAVSSIQLPEYEAIRRDAQLRLASQEVTRCIKQVYKESMLGRLAFWTWMVQVQDRTSREQYWGEDDDDAELEAVVSSAHGGAAETWLAQALVQACVLDRLDGLTSILSPFYLGDRETTTSKALFDHDGRALETLMFESTVTTLKATGPSTTAWLLSPIDEVYHLDKSKVAAKIEDPATVIAAALQAVKMIKHVNHDMMVVTLMKIFLVGDREGQNPHMMSDREVFWDNKVQALLEYHLDLVCRRPTTLARLEEAWWRSSDHVRQAQVPFFQFYQTFVAQYAAVSFGYHGFARLLGYLNHTITEVDYRHLLWSDYSDVLRTIRIRPDELPEPQATTDRHDALLRLYWNAVLENGLEKKEKDAMYQFALGQLRHGMQYAPDTLRMNIEDSLQHAADETVRKDWQDLSPASM